MKKFLELIGWRKAESGNSVALFQTWHTIPVIIVVIAVIMAAHWFL